MAKKLRARIANKDIYSEVARHTDLKVEQVKQCFYVYAELVRSLSVSEYREKGFEIPLPKVGYFYFIEKKGRKKGSTYAIPKTFYREQKEKINDDTDNPYFSLTLEEDEPNYETLSFKVYQPLYDSVKRSSRNKNLKDNNG